MSANDDDLDVHTQTDLNITVSKFVDLDFPIDKFNWESLQKHKIYWKRPSDLCPSPTLYGSAISASDVRQGSLGDCFFIAALSLLCSQPDAVRKLFIDVSELQEAGLYSLQFFQFGVWKRVLIDDQLPTRRLRKKPIGYRLVLGRNAQSQVFWVSLIEKAYAKLYGSYESLRGGNISEALVDLTGAPVYDYNLDATDFMAKPFWAILLRQAARGAMIGCAACLPDVADDDDDDDDDQGRTSTGIQSNHAYSIQYILAEKLDGKLRKFILVKDPQRDGQKMSFSGALTDPSKWTASEAELLSQTELHPGLFWMTWKEFRTQFNRVYICQYDLLPLCQTTSIYGDWDNDTAGGCTDYASWKCNPSYVVEGELLAISLQQPDRRTASRQNAQPLSYTMIGLTVVRPPAFEDDPFLITKPSEALCRTAFWNKRDVAVEAYETWPDRVIIVPSFHEPGLTGKFVMNIYSKGNVTVRRRQTDLEVVRQRSQWSETSSGGGPLSAGFPRNPKFLLNASISGPLRQSDSEPLVVFIGLRVLSRSSRCKMGICILKKAIYALEALDGLHGSLDKSWFLGAPSFEIQEEVNRRLEIPNDQLPVLIIPCTWEPNLQAEFELTVSSRRMATCVPILPVLSNDANQ